jgi:hypothetical protein
MSKQVPEAVIHFDAVEWRDWDEKRTMPFTAEGVQGRAKVKVLSKDPSTGAESLVYELEPGWSAERLENTVYENLFVLDGELVVDGQALQKHAFSYRPEGHVTGPVSTTTGVEILAYAGAPGELSSKIPVPSIDTTAMPWTVRPVGVDDARYFVKILRGDEQNLDSFYLMRTLRGLVGDGAVIAHDGPEESYILDGRGMFHDSITGGRVVMTKGTYVHRDAWSPHGDVTILEDSFIYKHDYFTHYEGAGADAFMSGYPEETEAVRALKEGRDPGLPKRWTDTGPRSGVTKAKD